ncbi:S-layer homology domain-containing protein [Arthrobacter sp. cf158]|uniref:carboxypeptidase regulatory-like domain-containing protein n=1 Tax=Arthrobacter sp. cf158 TaxID=1761744 RepID=UPI00089D3D48|nr:carboxypeptidase regulatory-like domain-containing protein [Arthrobacter sp. cf158]SDX40612.1 S-layer homology domain-containing protein [Arthrobacter sp. cf158]
MKGIARGRFRLALALLGALVLGALPAGFASPAFAAATGSISGTVTVPAGVDVTRIDIATLEGPSQEDVRPDADGKFTFPALVAGQYKLQFSEAGHPIQTLSTFYGGSTREQATVVVVAEGAAVTGINQTMRMGGAIAGKVTVPSGVDPTAVTVIAEGPGGTSSDTVTADGSYVVKGLETGGYKVAFFYGGTSSPVLNSYYPNASRETATLVAVTEGSTVSGINETLKPAATISGKISVPAGAAAYNGQVMVEAGPDFTKNDFAGSAFLSSDNAGNFTIGGLKAGTYKLHYRAYDDTWATMWHKGVADPANSPWITVTDGQKLTGIQDSAVAAASIAGSIAGAPAPGQVQNGPGMSITAVTANGTVASSTVMETSQTTYALKNLLPGSYKIQFNRTLGFVSAYEAQSYRDLPESSGTANATPVTVAAGQGVSNINATVRLGGTLTGKVLGSNGSPLFDTRVNVYTKDGFLVTRRAYTAPDGTFKVTGLTTGLYFVSAEPAGQSGPIFSGNVLTEANARSVAAAVGQNSDIGTLSYATATQGARGFDDVPLGAQFQDEIQWLADKGISTGWEANGSRTYQPLSPVNRDAMAAFMYRLAGKPDFTAPAVSPFKDLPVGTQFYKEITWLADKGISTGWVEADKSKTYRPLQPVNRDAMAAFMYRLAGEPEFTAPKVSPFVDVPVGAQFYKEITWLAAQGISTGWAETGNAKSFRPLQPVNRDAMAAFMFRYNTKFGAN